MRRALYSMLLMLCLAIPASAQPTTSSGLINQQLDQQVKLSLSGTLSQAMEQIAKATGVPIEAQPAVWELLPWGKDTAVTATFENQTLRQALDAMTKRLGLTFALKDEAVELQPMPALRRLGRKSTVTELQALYALASTPLEFKSDKPQLKDLVEAIDLKLAAGKTQYQVVNRSSTSPDKVPQNAPVAVGRDVSLLDALEAISSQTPATWYPWGRDIIILAKQDQTRRLLNKDITLRHEGTDVGQVLAELSARSGVRFTYEPGCIQALPPQVRNIKLVLSATVLDALEAISGATGLGYIVKDDEVYVWNTSTAPGGQARDRAIGWFQTDSGMMLMITESQCPADIREFLETQKKKQFEAIRKMMVEQGFKPSATVGTTTSRPVPEKPIPPTPAPTPSPTPSPSPAPTPAPGKDL